jgi:hypothetical protein
MQFPKPRRSPPSCLLSYTYIDDGALQIVSTFEKKEQGFFQDWQGHWKKRGGEKGLCFIEEAAAGEAGHQHQSGDPSPEKRVDDVVAERIVDDTCTVRRDSDQEIASQMITCFPVGLMYYYLIAPHSSIMYATFCKMSYTGHDCYEEGSL